jgi:hypothetical protein
MFGESHSREAKRPSMKWNTWTQSRVKTEGGGAGKIRNLGTPKLSCNGVMSQHNPP